MVDLKNTTRPPPTAARVPIGHIEVGVSGSRRIVAVGGVKSDGPWKEDWRRQLGGIAGLPNCWRRLNHRDPS